MKKTTSRAAALLFASAIGLVALSGCAAGGAAASPQPTVTVTKTSTPAPSTASPDDPLDALTAWTACNVLAQSQAPDKKLNAYDPAHPAEQQPDGSWRAIIGYPIEPPTEGAKSVVIVCDVKGTLGAPDLVQWTMKDI